MKTVCSPEKCAGCMACADICPHGAVCVAVEPEHCVPRIDPEKCTDCGLCGRVCQNHSNVPLELPRQWLQGWAADPQIRAAGSSGGVAGALTKGFLENGGVVCSCVFENGRFGFRIAQTPEEAQAFTGSKYVKSDPSGAYRQIKALLKAGKKVLLIALPCQVAAARLYVGALGEQLYCADLICHGSPAPGVLERFLEQEHLQLSDPRFRKKQCYRLSDGVKPIRPEGVLDHYTLAFLNGLTYTENCYSCAYAQEARPGDLTLGDAWGVEAPAEEAARGISLVLCQNEKGQTLLNYANLTLFPADRELSLANNHQLCHPSEKPHGWAEFWQGLSEGGSFRKLVAWNFPRQCRRQSIKACLSRLGFYKGGSAR